MVQKLLNFYNLDDRFMLDYLILLILLSVLGLKLSFNEWSWQIGNHCLAQCNSIIIYERRSGLQSQVLYVIPITPILGRLAFVPVCDTGTIPYSMPKQASTFLRAACNSKLNKADGNQWWYVDIFGQPVN